MFPRLPLPESPIGVSPAHPNLICLPLETYKMLRLISFIAIHILCVVIWRASHIGARTGDVKEGSEWGTEGKVESTWKKYC